MLWAVCANAFGAYSHKASRKWLYHPVMASTMQDSRWWWWHTKSCRGGQRKLCLKNRANILLTNSFASSCATVHTLFWLAVAVVLQQREYIFSPRGGMRYHHHLKQVKWETTAQPYSMGLKLRLRLSQGGKKLQLWRVKLGVHLLCKYVDCASKYRIVQLWMQLLLVCSPILSFWLKRKFPVVPGS